LHITCRPGTQSATAHVAHAAAGSARLWQRHESLGMNDTVQQLWQGWQAAMAALAVDELQPAMPAWKMMLRAIAVYLAALIMVRIGKRRFLGRYTSFDVLLGFVVGSLMARAITGAVTLLNMAAVVATMIALHWILVWVALRFGIGGVLKGSARRLIEDGKVDTAALRDCGIGERDLEQALREKAHLESPQQVRSAYFERDGSITIIPARREPQVIEFDVADGVQRVRVVIDR
jgi:uncharacterized membrane protein YcaP (DUF421 family)